MGLNRQDCADRIKACLIGGAIGDALGASVEFDKIAAIRARFGAAGVEEFEEACGRIGAITDDTQMTLFTAEGLVRAHVRGAQRGICHPPSIVHHAYLRWLFAQGIRPRVAVAERENWPDGWLIRDKRLFSRRAPGNTCLAALSAAKSLGEPAKNDSKGCGTVMRVAPIGLLLDPDRAFAMGAETSALTHGHPTGILAGGAFAAVVAHLTEGTTLQKAVAETRARVADKPDSGEVTSAIDAASKLATKRRKPSPEEVESLGAGWTAEEALSIAIYCALVAQSFEHGVLLAVNHSGDSDSTGSMAGQLLGLMQGFDAIPERWRSKVELSDMIETIAADLTNIRAGRFDTELNWERYPGW